MTRKDFEFDSRDNETKIHAVKWLPDAEPKGILILVHGMAEHIDRYEPFAAFMCDKGFIVAGNEHLAMADQSEAIPRDISVKEMRLLLWYVMSTGLKRPYRKNIRVCPSLSSDTVWGRLLQGIT